MLPTDLAPVESAELTDRDILLAIAADIAAVKALVAELAPIAEKMSGSPMFSMLTKLIR